MVAPRTAPLGAGSAGDNVLEMEWSMPLMLGDMQQQGCRWHAAAGNEGQPRTATGAHISSDHARTSVSSDRRTKMRRCAASEIQELATLGWFTRVALLTGAPPNDPAPAIAPSDQGAQRSSAHAWRTHPCRSRAFSLAGMAAPAGEHVRQRTVRRLSCTSRAGA